jgi:hypothetical protein
VCIIVYEPKPGIVDKATMERCFIANPDGAGIMFPAKGGTVQIIKGCMTFNEYWKAYQKASRMAGESPVVSHFRISTGGKVNKTCCHPHRIGPTLAMVHNGILHGASATDTESDTMVYVREYLEPLPEGWHKDEAILNILGQAIGPSNKFVILDGKGNVSFVNGDRGVWEGEVWYSNESYKPRQRLSFYTPWDWDDTPKSKAIPKLEALTNEADDEDRWSCFYCKKDLETWAELAEGQCLDCWLAEGNDAQDWPDEQTAYDDVVELGLTL